LQLTDYDIECLNKAKVLIEADLSVHFTIATIAEKTGMGATRLKKLFKGYFGSPLFTYLHQQRMQRAKQLLEDTNNPIKAVAKKTGYHHSRNFITAFTRYHGITPGELRKKAV
jgi:AraC family transcriptional activator of pyochelin receptor